MAKILQGAQFGGPSVPPHASRAFCSLIKAVGESGTNHEEDRIIRREVRVLEQALKQPNIQPRQMKEFLVRLIYCEMLGHEVPFGYIHAVKFCQQTSLLEKRVGYLAVSLLLHEDHELSVLLVHTIQRDLKSNNVAEVCMALTAVTRLMNAEMIPAILPLVEKKLSHSGEIVRKKAVLALHRFHTRSPASVSHLHDTLRRALCDSDPGVMAASLNMFHDLARDETTSFKDLASTFVSILKQIVEHRLPREFDYHKVPAPWMQIKLLRILAILGQDDQSASECMYEVIRDCLRRGDINSTAAYGIVYECIRTITSIYPSAQLVELAARSVGRFLRSENNNLKYMGITSLASIVQVNPVYAAEHQMVVIDCLDDPDETLKRKTLDLLCKMTNPANVVVITERLISYLSSTVDSYLRKDLVPRIVQLAERYAPDNQWFVETMNSLFELAGDLIQAEVAHNLMRLIAEGTEDEEMDQELRVYAAESYIDLLETPNLPDLLVQTICWVVGEYAYLATEYDQAIVIEMVAAMLDRKYQDDGATKTYILTALTKLVSQTGLYPAEVQAAITQYKASKYADLEQRAYELEAMVAQAMVMRSVLPLDASSEDIEVDPDLFFLDDIVNAALAAGAKPYQTPAERAPPPVVEHEDADKERLRAAFNFEAYEAPEVEPPRGTTHRSEGLAASPEPAVVAAPSLAAPAQEPTLAAPTLGLKVKKRRWGKGGDLGKKGAAAPTPAGEAQEQEPTAAPLPDMSVMPTSKVQSKAEAGASKPTPAPEMYTLPHTKAAEPTPEVDERKQQLASQLFATSAAPTRKTRTSRARKAGGGGGGRQGTAAATPASAAPLVGDLMGPDAASPATALSPTPAPASAPSGGIMDDLLGLGLAASPSPTAHAASAQPAMPPPTYHEAASQSAAQSGGMGDLLGSLLDAPSPAATATPSTSGGVDLLGMLGGGANAAPAAPTMDLLGGDLLSGSSTTAPPEPQASVGLFSPAPDQPDLPPELASLPHFDSGEVTRDSTIAVRYAKVWKPEALAVVLFLRNQEGMRQLAGVVTQLDLPGTVRRIDSTSTQMTDNIAAGCTAQHVMHVTAATVDSAMSIKTQVSFTDASQKGRSVYVNVSLAAGDFLRPRPITTEQFGAQWGASGGERKQKFAGIPVTTSQAFMDVVSSELHLHPVQIIGSEAICAGQVLADPHSACLAHAKITAAAVELTVRSKSVQFSEAVIRHFAACTKA